MALAEIRRHRFTVEEYHRMGAIGLLHPDNRVELIEGEIIDMSPIGRAHRSIVGRIDRVLQQTLGDHAFVLVQASVLLTDISEPEPDVAVLLPRDDLYIDRDPSPADIHVLIEVGDSSLRYDRLVKAPLYARSGVAEVWLVDLVEWTIHVLTRPEPEGYADEQTVGTFGTVTVLGREIPVRDLLGPQASG